METTETTPTSEIPENPEPVVAASEPDAGPKWNWLMFVLPIAFFVLGLASGWLIWGSGIRLTPATVSRDQIPGNPDAAALAAAQAEPALEIEIPEQLTRLEVTIEENDAIWGPEDAPITIVEFSDYECPYCGKWYEETLRPLMAEYPDQIRFVYKDFPLSFHPEAMGAAVAAHCAREQDAYWAYHNALFSQQYGLGDSAYQKYASDMGLNMKKFNTCVEEQRYKDEIDADLAYAMELGISSTPTFLLNGIPIVGAQPYNLFKQVIEWELAGELP